MAQNDSDGIGGTLDKLKTVTGNGKQSRTVQETIDILRRVGVEPRAPKAAPGITSPEANYVNQYSNYMNTADNAAKAPETSMGFWEYAFRVLGTGYRTAANMVDTVIDYSNRANDLKKKGDLWGSYGQLALSVPDTVWSGIKGVGQSLFPEFDKFVKPIDGRDIKDNFYEVLKGDAYTKFASEAEKEGTTALKDIASEKKIGEVVFSPLDVAADVASFVGNKKAEADLRAKAPDSRFVQDITPAGLTSFTADVFLDPTTYMTFGVGGAARGFFRGANEVTQMRKAAGKQVGEGVTNVPLPRPYYGLPEKVVPYSLENTSPLTYIAKETRRGAQSAFEASLNRRILRSDRNQARLQFLAGLIFKGAEKGADNLSDEVLFRTSDEVLNEIIQNESVRLQAEGTAPDELALKLEEMRGDLQEVVTKFAEDPSFVRSTLQNTEAIKKIKNDAAQKGIAPLEEATWRAADHYALSIRESNPIIARTEPAKIGSEALEALGKNIELSANAKTGSGKWGGAWDGFVKQADADTIKEAVRLMLSPVGYRERFARASAKATKAELAKDSDLVDAIYGLRLNPTARGSRTEVDDVEAVKERVMGTKFSRVTYRQKQSAEYKAILGRFKEYSDKTYGAGSQTTRSKRVGPSEEEIKNAHLDFAESLGKAVYGDAAWSNMRFFDKASALKEVLANPASLTGEVLEKVAVSPYLLGARLQYLAGRAVMKETPEFSQVKHLQKNGYNPLTAESRSLRSQNLASTDLERKGKNTLEDWDAPIKIKIDDVKVPNTRREVVRLILESTGHVEAPAVDSVLKKFGLKKTDYYMAGSILPISQIDNILQKMLVKTRMDAEKFYSAKQLMSGSKFAAVDRTKFDSFDKFYAELGRTNAIVTEKDVTDAIAELGTIMDNQIAAVKKLADIGFDIYGSAAPLRTAVASFGRSNVDARRLAKTPEVKQLEEIRKVLSPRASNKAIDAQRDRMPSEVFGPIITELEAKLASGKLLPAAKAAIDRILNHPSYGFKNAGEAPLSPAQMAAYFAAAGSALKREAGAAEQGALRGFENVFKRANGEYDYGAMGYVMLSAFRGSRSKNSMDSGWFADYVTKMYNEKHSNRLASGEMKPIDQLTDAELQKAIQGMASDWRGQGFTVATLEDALRNVEASGTKQAVSKLETPKAMDAGRFESDVDRMVKSLFDRMVEDIIDEEQYLSKILRAENPTATEDLGFGRMERAIGANAEEQVIIDDIVNKTPLPLTADAIRNLKTILDSKILTVKIKVTKAADDEIVREFANIKEGDLLAAGSIRRLASALDEAMRIPQLKAGVAIAKPIKALYFQQLRLSNRKAAEVIAKKRAEAIITATFPTYATKNAIMTAAKRLGKTEKAKASARIRIMLAEILAAADREILRNDNANTVLQRLQSRLDKSPNALKQEAEKFGKLLDTVSKKFEKNYKVDPNFNFDENKFLVEAVGSDATFINQVYMENPLLFIEKVRRTKVTTGEQQAEWSAMMDHLLNLESVDGKAAFRDYKELLDSYATASKEMKPGDFNPFTGSIVPTPEQVVETLRTLGIVAADETPTLRRNVLMNILEKNADRIDGEDFMKMRQNDFISQVNLAGANDIREGLAEAADPTTVVAKLEAELISRMAKANAEGNDIQNIIAAGAAFKSLKWWAGGHAGVYDNQITDALGRQVATTKPNEAGKMVKRKALLRSFEGGEANLQGWKFIVANASDMAKQAGYAPGSAERRTFMTRMVMETGRIRDLYQMSRGIIPSNSVKLKVGDGRILKIFNNDDEALKGIKMAYLSEFDVMGVFDEATLGRLFFDGKELSLPPTALMPAARLLVAAYDNLKPGNYFNAEQLSALSDTMTQLMQNHIGKQTSVQKFGKVSMSSLDPDGAAEKIKLVVLNLLDPEKAAMLHATHIDNAVLALSVFKYKSREVNTEILDAWGRAVNAPLASSGSRIQATMEAMSEVQKFVNDAGVGIDAKIMAVMDANGRMASGLDHAAIVELQEAVEIASAGSKEAAAIKAVQAASRRAVDSDVAAALVRTASQNTQLSVSGMALKARQMAESPEVGIDDAFDVFNEARGGDARLNVFLKFFDNIGTAFSYNKGMQSIRDRFGGAERLRIEDATEMSVVAVEGVAKYWKDAAPDRNILKEAWDALRQADPAELDIAIDSRMKLTEALRNNGVIVKDVDGVPTPTQLDNATMAQLQQDAAMLKGISEEDEQLVEAASQLWAMLGHIVGGGENSRLARMGVTPKHLNLEIRKTGANKKGFIDKDGNFTPTKDGYGFNPNAKHIKDVVNDWREWDIENPLDVIVGLNNALYNAAKVPHAAADLTKNFGVLKSSISPEEAKKAGLVSVKTANYLSADGTNALVYFMPTEQYYYPLALAKELRAASEYLGKVGRLASNQSGLLEKTLRSFDGIQNFAKQWMTLLTVKNWVTNTGGGIITNYLAGVNSPVAYARAIKMLKNSGVRPEDFGMEMSGFEKMITDYYGQRAAENLVIKAANDPRKSETLTINIAGKETPISYTDLEKLYTEIGGRVPVAQSRELDLVEDAANPSNLNKAGVLSKVWNKYNSTVYTVGRWAGKRDDILRATLWLDQLSKQSWKDLESGARESLRVIDRYHPQMQDLSAVNREITRRMVMFFTWRAKTTAWVLADLGDRPGRILTLQKAQYYANEMNGMDVSGLGDQTYEDYPLPEYLRYNLDPMAVTESGRVYKYTVANPVTDLLGSNSWFGGINFNNYQPAYEQLGNISMDTFDRMAIDSMPLALGLGIDWLVKKETMNKTKIGSGPTGDFDWNKDMPLLIEDGMKRLGWGPQHLFLARAFPDTVGANYSAWKDLTKDQVDEKFWTAFYNYITGARLTPINTVDNIQRGVAEEISKQQRIQGSQAY